MIGVVQKITCSEDYPAEYFVQRELLFHKFLNEENSEEKMNILTEFETEYMSVAQYVANLYPEDHAVLGRKQPPVVVKGNPDCVYIFFKFNADEWADLQNYSSMKRVNELRPTFFSIVGWQNLGFRVVNSLPEHVTYSLNGLADFDSWKSVAEEVWNSSTEI